MTDIRIPTSVTNIGSGAFHGSTWFEQRPRENGCVIINNIVHDYCRHEVIPEGVTCIGADAFYACVSLGSIIIPQGVTSIEGSALYGCTGLNSITISKSVTSIGVAVFKRCYLLADEKGFVIVNNILFGCIGTATNVVIPNGVTKISASAFHCIKALNSVPIPKGGIHVNGLAFFSCKNPSEINIPKGVANIRADAFCRCKNITFYGMKGSYAE